MTADATCPTCGRPTAPSPEPGHCYAWADEHMAQHGEQPGRKTIDCLRHALAARDAECRAAHAHLSRVTNCGGEDRRAREQDAAYRPDTTPAVDDVLRGRRRAT